MPPRKTPLHMTLKLSLVEPRVEMALLKVRMYQSGCTCRPDIFQNFSDQLCLLLKFIVYKEKLEKKNARMPPPS